jgi:hypothetical protein
MLDVRFPFKLSKKNVDSKDYLKNLTNSIELDIELGQINDDKDGIPNKFIP